MFSSTPHSLKDSKGNTARKKTFKNHNQSNTADFILSTSDLLTLIHMIANTPSLHNTNSQHNRENCIPICLPEYNSKAFLQAYVVDLCLMNTAITSNTNPNYSPDDKLPTLLPLTLILLAVDNDIISIFPDIQYSREQLELQLNASNFYERMLISNKMQTVKLIHHIVNDSINKCHNNTNSTNNNNNNNNADMNSLTQNLQQSSQLQINTLSMSDQTTPLVYYHYLYNHHAKSNYSNNNNINSTKGKCNNNTNECADGMYSQWFSPVCINSIVVNNDNTNNNTSIKTSTTNVVNNDTNASINTTASKDSATSSATANNNSTSLKTNITNVPYKELSDGLLLSKSR